MWSECRRLAQYRVTTVKTIATNWLFILQPIKEIQLVKHPIYAVLLERGWLRRVFFHMTCRLEAFSLFWQYVWMLNLFFFLHGKISLFTYLAKFLFFFNSTYIRDFNYRQIFEGKSYLRLIFRNIQYLGSVTNSRLEWSFSISLFISLFITCSVLFVSLLPPPLFVAC